MTVFTIGHSNHSIEAFLDLLRRHEVDLVADVRSAPYSRRHPHFNKKALAARLEAAGIRYSFFGDRLGARPDDPACYVDGKVSYEHLAATAAFRAGIEELCGLAPSHRLALMCAEREPLDCHRTILIARQLDAEGVPVAHLLAGGGAEAHAETVQRLLHRTGLGSEELFRDRASIVAEAFARRASQIAYPRS